ncbi:ArsR family transcriptional regulator [Mycetocola tolaasinivorans]|uniref:ArsR family transcriptional regulator n=1 Tax=Mycetocola tolaasinivorans TaxID=76635 RepID=A0A3L7A6B7_9MICO|nr:helix-turn-helix domain-containing protein [Mycetocola tolaasinivorans]RLP75615.1 ArsR family transcriptional regulator [Mycetocola tolaasinivorans]
MTDQTSPRTDAAALRVLAHPTRIRLLALLREHGPQTAALLADRVDEAPGTLSYHLTRLAEAGFIEPAPEAGTDRRERWWRARHELTTWKDSELLDDPERRAAAREFQGLIGQFYASQYAAYVDSMPQLDTEWVDAATSGDRILRLTAAELGELGAELNDLLARWSARSEAHVSGDDAERVFVLAQAYRKPATS